MKTARTIILMGFALSFGFLAARWSAAQSSNRPPSKGPITGDNNPALEQLNLLVSHLEATKQTNALKLFNDYESASIAQQQSADMGVTLHTLMALRESRTNDALQLLEIKLDANITSFVAFFKELPVAQRESLGLNSLTKARWYRDKYPLKHRDPTSDAYIAQAFELLDKKPVK